MSDYSYSDNDSDLESIEERIVTKKKSNSTGISNTATSSSSAAATSSSVSTKKAIDSDIDDDELVETESEDEDSVTDKPSSSAKKSKNYNSDDSSVDELTDDEDKYDEEGAAEEEEEEFLEEDASNSAALKKSAATASANSAFSKKKSRFDEALFEEDEDDEDNEVVYGKTQENYLEMFDKKIREDIISNYYPELIQQNYDEVSILATVVRDEDGMICDPLHTTLPFITKYEKARILGERARQINSGSLPMITVDDDIIDGYLIALKELEQKKIPFIIKRPLPSGSVEYWRLEDLELL